MKQPMGPPRPAWDLRSLPESCSRFEAVKQLIEEHQHILLRRMLHNNVFFFSSGDARALCAAAIRNGLGRRAFGLLLAHCPPAAGIQGSLSQTEIGKAPPFLHPNYNVNASAWVPSCSLVGLAVAHSRCDLLDLLLQRGFDPNRGCPDEVSPLELALYFSSRNCLERLLCEPALDLTLTPRILDLWGDTGNVTWRKSVGAACLRAYAAKLPPELFFPFRAREVPLPRALTVRHSFNHHNDWLFCRLCEQGVFPTEEEAELAISSMLMPCRDNPFGLWPRRSAPPPLGSPEYDWLDSRIVDSMIWSPRDPQPRAAAVLAALLKHYPALFELPQTRTLAVYYHLTTAPAAVKCLAPWIARMKNEQIMIDRMPECTSIVILYHLLQLWEKRLPNGPVPALDPDCFLEEMHNNEPSLSLKGPTQQQYLHTILLRCKIVRRRKKTHREKAQPSMLAHALLETGTPQMLAEQFRPGGLLWDEAPEALLDYCMGDYAAQIPRENLAALAALMHKEERYEL